MGRQCLWCSNEVPLPESGRHAGQSMTRTLCTDCSEQFVFQMGVPLQNFLDSLPAPVFVVDSDVHVKSANKLGTALLQKSLDDIREKWGGVVFECSYARLPGGCGRTIHCSACAIRRSIYHTFETGQSLTGVPATMEWATEGKKQDIALRISTEKMGNVVLLRIDHIGAPERGR